MLFEKKWDLFCWTFSVVILIIGTHSTLRGHMQALGEAKSHDNNSHIIKRAKTPAYNLYQELQNKEAVAINLSANQDLAMPDYFHHVLQADVDLLHYSFTRLMHDHILLDEDLIDRPFALIQCNISLREERFFEDVLYFAYNNDVPVNFTFHLESWQKRKLSDVEYLFDYFTTDCDWDDVGAYLQANPYATVLFTPKKDERVLVKKNITAVIIAYNQLTYVAQMVEQLKKYTSDIVIIDNCSTFEPLLRYYADFPYTVLRQPTNVGYKVYLQPHISKLIGRVFLLTDPDLKFNDRLPDDFIQTLLKVSDRFEAGKVGFALSIEGDIRDDVTYTPSKGEIRPYGIKEWEQQFWKNRLDDDNLEMYKAPLDTTFCLMNRKYYEKHGREGTRFDVRIAGDFTCEHIPWYKRFEEGLEKGELEAYLNKNKCTNWTKGNHIK